ncbi:MAG: hypothetical protein JWQ84_3038 [Mucilaginibacter sp.]|nr:hypothetical protein [Mucilaginibacter sp.]
MLDKAIKVLITLNGINWRYKITPETDWFDVPPKFTFENLKHGTAGLIRYELIYKHKRMSGMMLML